MHLKICMVISYNLGTYSLSSEPVPLKMPSGSTVN